MTDTVTISRETLENVRAILESRHPMPSIVETRLAVCAALAAQPATAQPVEPVAGSPLQQAYRAMMAARIEAVLKATK